jgi:hypothetical protein
MAAFEDATGRVNGAQCLMTAADQQPLRHCKAQKSGLMQGLISATENRHLHMIVTALRLIDALGATRLEIQG